MIKFLSFQKRYILFKAFIGSKFRYSLLVWMFHGRQINNKINQLIKRAFWTVCNNTVTSFEDLLIKTLNDLSERNFRKFITRTNHSNKLPSESELIFPSINTVNKGKILSVILDRWQRPPIPANIKNIKTLESFEREMRKRIPKNCLCQLFKNYIGILGFVNISYS